MFGPGIVIIVRYNVRLNNKQIVKLGQLLTFAAPNFALLYYKHLFLP